MNAPQELETHLRSALDAAGFSRITFSIVESATDLAVHWGPETGMCVTGCDKSVFDKGLRTVAQFAVMAFDRLAAYEKAKAAQ